MIQLEAPFTEEKIRALKQGDEVEITGVLFTGRDAAHKYLHEGGALPDGMSLQDKIIYHCGPVVIKDEEGNWKVVAAGPTTSAREEPYQGDIIKQFGLRAVIGKGGMGERTLKACKEFRVLLRLFTRRGWCSPGALHTYPASQKCLFPGRVWFARSDVGAGSCEVPCFGHHGFSWPLSSQGDT